jgi:hypothetical protein
MLMSNINGISTIPVEVLMIVLTCLINVTEIIVSKFDGRMTNLL